MGPKSANKNEKTPGTPEMGVQAAAGSGVLPRLPQLPPPLNMDTYEDDWFQALKALAVERLREALGADVQPVAPGSGVRTCGDDEAMHFVTPYGLVHLCYTSPDEITFEWEVECPECGQLMPLSTFTAHMEIEHGGGK